MLDPQLYQSRVASAAEISSVPTHGDPGQADDPDQACACEELGKIVRSKRAQANRDKSAENVPGNHDEIKGWADTEETKILW